MKLFCAYAFTGEDVDVLTERMETVVDTLTATEILKYSRTLRINVLVYNSYSMQAKKYTGLSDAERSEIEILFKRGCSKREIAQALGRSPNTISREIRVHSVNGNYTALKAKQKSRASRRSRRYQWRKIEHEPQLRAFIIEHLALPITGALTVLLVTSSSSRPSYRRSARTRYTPGCTVPTANRTVSICCQNATIQSVARRTRQTGS